MSHLHLVETPPPPTKKERTRFYHGKSNAQYARMDKKTGEVELWWTGNGGYWQGYPSDDASSFMCEARMKP